LRSFLAADLAVVFIAVNTPAHDFACPVCCAFFQLKSKSTAIGNRIQDGAFSAMKKAILTDETPNLFLLHYQLPHLIVQNLVLIPHFAFSLSLLEKRPQLSASARRAGWIGCSFLLDRIPPDAKISVICTGKAVPRAEVRKAFQKAKPLEKVGIEKRGWTLDVLNVIRSLGRRDGPLEFLVTVNTP
jgi:type II restriction enzyme